MLGNLNNFAYNTSVWALTPEQQVSQINEVLPYLFISNRDMACNFKAVKKHKITHLICMTTNQLDANLIKKYQKSGIFYHAFPLEDVVQQSLMPVASYIHMFLTDVGESYRHHQATSNMRLEALPSVIEMNAAKDPPRILVFCDMGISRSASMVLYHLMQINGWTYDQAAAYLRAIRPIIRPNSGFETQLRVGK